MKKTIIGIIIILAIIVSAVILVGVFNKSNNSEIPDGYIAIFNGGAGEITYSTYIYKIDKGQSNYGFEYINTTNTTTSWGSAEWNTKITGKGKTNRIEDIFSIAKQNGAYSYVKLPNDDKIYTIEEYMNIMY